MKLKTTEISAVVRVLLKITDSGGINKFNNRPEVSVNKVEVFPNAFKYSEDFIPEHYRRIEDDIKKQGARLFDSIPTNEVGVYEIVGTYQGKFSMDSAHNYVEGIWDMHDIKAYQLSEEEVALLTI